MTINISTEISKEKLYSANQKQQKKQQAEQKQESIIKQEPNLANGLQWTAAQNANVQQTQKTDGAQKGQMQDASAKPASPELVAPSIDDIAILSSTVSMNEEGISALAEHNAVINFSKLGLNAAVLEQSFKEIYKKSKSHNMLLERFMSNVKMGGVSMLLALTGMSAENIDEIKAQVREEALKEIDTKLSQDWAYTKAMLDITGG